MIFLMFLNSQERNNPFCFQEWHQISWLQFMYCWNNICRLIWSVTLLVVFCLEGKLFIYSNNINSLPQHWLRRNYDPCQQYFKHRHRSCSRRYQYRTYCYLWYFLLIFYCCHSPFSKCSVKYLRLGRRWIVPQFFR